MPSRYEKYTTHHTSRRADGWDYTQPAAYFVTICTQDRLCLFGTVEEERMALNSLGQIVAEEWKRSEEIRDRVHLDAFVVMPNHLHGIVVFADPDVTAPTSPRGYRAFGTGDSPSTPDATVPPSDPPDPPGDENASTGGSDDQSGSDNPNDGNAADGGGNERMGAKISNVEKASHRRATLAETDGKGNPEFRRPPRSLGSFVAGFKSAATTRINRHRDTPGAAVWQRNYHDRIIRSERHWRAAREYVRTNPARWHEDRLQGAANA